MIKIDTILSIIELAMIHPGLLILARELRKKRKTYLDYPRLLHLGKNYKVSRYRSKGAPRIAEFGVGRGGSAMFFAWLIQHYGGHLTLFDVFEQIPAPTDSDGERARLRYQEIRQREDQTYYGNLPDLMETLKAELSNYCRLDKIDFVRGKYQDSLHMRPNKENFDLVHIDCDWYESTSVVLEFLKPRLTSHAIMQIDDYAYWPGTKKATDEAAWLRPYQRKLVNDALIIDTGILRQDPT